MHGIYGQIQTHTRDFGMIVDQSLVHANAPMWSHSEHIEHQEEKRDELEFFSEIALVCEVSTP